MSRLRVAVVCDRIGELGSADAGTALARGFAAHAQVVVVPVAVGGSELAHAVAALADVEVEIEQNHWRVRTQAEVLIGFQQPPAPGWAPGATTTDVGEWVVDCLAGDEVRRVILDLTGVTAHDGGAGLLAAAGGSLAGRELVGIVAAAELEVPATGIGGGLARRAFAARLDVAELLGADAELAGRANALGAGLADAAGGGAAGGSALAVLALGGRLVSGTQFCHRIARLGRTLAAADLVVTGCTELTALDRGGPVVNAVAAWAEQAQRPCVLFTTGAGLARRELRTIGIEAAYLLVPGQSTAAALTAAADRIAAAWVPGRGEAHVD